MEEHISFPTLSASYFRHRRLLYVLLNYYRRVQRTRPSIRVSITSTLIQERVL